MKIDINTGFNITCIFKAEIVKSDGTVVDTSSRFRNRVLDCGMLALYSNTVMSLMTYINVGDGLTQIADEDTGLSNRKFSTNAVYNSTQYLTASKVEGYTGYLRVFQFAIGTCTGDFTEVGLSVSNNSNYFNRQFFKDADGNQIIVRVKSDEGLRITAEVRIYKDPVFKSMFSKILLLNLNGATAGTLTLTNGTNEATLSYSRISNINYFYNDIHAYILTNKPILCLEGSIANGYYIYMNPLLESDVNLYIKSHTLTGGTAEPEMYIINEFTDKAHKNDVVKIEKDGASSEVGLKTCCIHAKYKRTDFLTLKKDYCDCSPWLHDGYIDINIIAKTLGSMITGFVFNDQRYYIYKPYEYNTTKIPALKDYSVTKQIYLYPYMRGSDRRVSDLMISGFVIGQSILAGDYGTNKNGVYLAVLDSPIIVAPREELEASFTISWNRYEDYIEGVV